MSDVFLHRHNACTTCTSEVSSVEVTPVPDAHSGAAGGTDSECSVYASVAWTVAST